GLRRRSPPRIRPLPRARRADRPDPRRRQLRLERDLAEQGRGEEADPGPERRPAAPRGEYGSPGPEAVVLRLDRPARTGATAFLAGPRRGANRRLRLLPRSTAVHSPAWTRPPVAPA